MNEAAQLSEVPGYRLVRPIGSSGATTVYQAMQRALERQVAVKVFCGPCQKKTCPLDHRCMTRVTPGMVFDAAVQLLPDRQSAGV